MADALITLLAIAQTALFQPPLDQPLTYVVEQVQRDHAGERRFQVERRLRFGRDARGLFAELTITAIGSDARAGGSGFEAGLAGLAGRTIRYRLDREGAIVAIDALDGHWAAWLAGMERGATSDDAKAALAKALAPLHSAPTAQRVAMLGSMLSPVIAIEQAREGAHAVRPVSRPATPPFGRDAMLVGIEVAEITGDGLLQVTTRVSGTHQPPAIVGAPAAPVERTSETVAVVDPDAGLLVGSEERVTTRIGDATTIAITRISFGGN